MRHARTPILYPHRSLAERCYPAVFYVRLTNNFVFTEFTSLQNGVNIMYEI